jgi:clathrin heavy chain
LEITTLNELESLELCRAVLNKGQIQMVETWLGQKKLTMSDQLGDLVRQYNPNLALKIFQESGSPDRVIQGLIEANQFDKILPYCQQTGHKPDFMKILRAVVPQNPTAAVNLAKMITVRDASGQPKTPLDRVVQVFLEHQRVQETTAILLEALKGNRPDESHLQTKLFEINLMSAPNVAEGIF